MVLEAQAGERAAVAGSFIYRGQDRLLTCHAAPVSEENGDRQRQASRPAEGYGRGKEGSTGKTAIFVRPTRFCANLRPADLDTPAVRGNGGIVSASAQQLNARIVAVGT